MFLNRLRQSYAFNILCSCGLLELILFISSIFGFILFFNVIGMLSILIFLISILIYSFELIFSIKISNQKFLCNKKITVMQNIGIIVFMLVVILDLIIFGSQYIKPFLYNLKF